MGIDKKATDKEIKSAYRKLAMKWHPDKNNESEEQKTKAEKMFKEVSEAFAVLSDKDKRQQHDMGFSLDDMQNGMGGFPGGAGGMGGMGFPGGVFMNMGGGMPSGFGGMGGGPGKAGGAGRAPGGMGFDPHELFKQMFADMHGGTDGDNFQSFVNRGAPGGGFGGMG